MIYAIAMQGDQVWFGTYGGGATLYDRARKVWKAYTTKGEPALAVDDGESIKWKNHLAYNHVSVIAPDTDRIWFGTYFYGFGGGGISYYNPRMNPPWKPLNTNRDRAKKVVSMAVDGESLWVGSEKGLSLLDKRTERWTAFYSTRDGLSGNFVNSLLVQGSFLWIGTNGGITRFDKSKRTWKSYSRMEGLTEIEIKSLARMPGSSGSPPGSDDRIWAAGAGGALFEYQGRTDQWMRIESSDPLKDGAVNALIATRQWIVVCRDNGVSLYDPSANQWEGLTQSDGLLSSTVFSAAEDKDSIWLGTDKGASRLLTGQLNR